MTRSRSQTSLNVLLALSGSHLINDLLQSLLPAVYPMLKEALRLNFWQIGLITLSNQLTASLLQPLVGFYADARPQPYLLAIGMGFTLVGVVLLSSAHEFGWLLAAAALVGIGSSVFHPESSRIARAASGGRHGLAQSLFQTGGNFGSSLGPLLAAFIVLPYGQTSISWFAVVALTGVLVLWRVGQWYSASGAAVPAAVSSVGHPSRAMPRREARVALVILVLLVFSKFIYLTSLTSYYTFYLIQKFGVSVQSAQLHLFAFLGAIAAGTFLGGPIGDRFGRKVVIWISILGALPFSLLLPHVNLFWTSVLSAIVGLVMSSAFSAILVYAQELVPGRVGLIAGLFFGVAFGIGGIGAAALGWIADATSIEFVYALCAYLPAIGLFTAWLPDVRTHRHAEPVVVAD